MASGREKTPYPDAAMRQAIVIAHDTGIQQRGHVEGDRSSGSPDGCAHVP